MATNTHISVRGAQRRTLAVVVLAAALAAAGLGKAGYTPKRVHTTAKVHLEKKGDAFAIPRIELETDAEVPGIDERAFQQQAETAKQNCPVSKLLAAAEITLKARLAATQ